MEKRNYVKPILSGEEFIPQVYCKNCSADDNTKYTYNFECNAGNKNYEYALYQENGKEAGLQTSGTNKDIVLASNSGFLGASFHPCGETHTVEVMGKLSEANLNKEFPLGYIVRNGVTTEVRIWDGEHCTTALTVSEFQLAKS